MTNYSGSLSYQHHPATTGTPPPRLRLGSPVGGGSARATNAGNAYARCGVRGCRRVNRAVTVASGSHEPGS